MQRRITMNLISGAILALAASVAPHAMACSLPGMNLLKPIVTFPPSLEGPRQPAAIPGTPVSIVGLWHVKFYSEGYLADDALDAWYADGNEVLNDFTNPIEGNVCLGVWTQTDTGKYKLKHPSWTFDGSGNLTGTASIYEAVTLSSDGNSYSGSYTIALSDLSGNPVGTYTGTIDATRIAAD